MKRELTFKKIHEEVAGSEQGEVSEESKEEIGAAGEEEGDRNPINERGRWWVYVLLGAGGIVVLSIVFFIIRKHVWVKKRRKKWRGKSNNEKTVEKFKS
jgi:hypothetical protein